MSGSNTSMLSMAIPAYAYKEYKNDDNIIALFHAYNQMAQNYATFFNTLSLPVYTGGIISGPLLDWVGQGLYGISRPVFSTSSSVSFGVINTFTINSGVPLGGQTTISSGTAVVVSDDIYKRIMTWNLYKGDGFQFTTEWLRRRVFRFLNGINGIDVGFDGGYTVNITQTAGAFTITVANTAAGAALQQAIADNLLNLPFYYAFTVVL